MTSSDFFLGLAIFIAAAVEAIEAITVILAIGVTRGWRSVWYATAASLATLTAITVVLGYSLLFVPLRYVWLVGGTILLIFGVQWIRKALLRYAGLKPERDELEAYDTVRRQALKNKQTATQSIDWYSFVIVYKAVLLEGLEILFIVIAFGAATANLSFGIIMSVITIVIVSLVAIILHKPLAKLPENSMKFMVGILLASFGSVFASNGAGIIWVNEYAMFMFLIALYLIMSLLTLYILSGQPHTEPLSRQRIIWLGAAILIASGLGLGLEIIMYNNPLPFIDVTYSGSEGELLV